VLGQPNLESNLINAGGISASTLNYPNGITGDGTHLIVADSNNKRVLIWNSMPTTSSQAADVVLGQSDFISSGSGTSSTRFSSPDAVYTNGTLLYVVDRSNNRILGWNSIPTVNGTAANFVLGQTDFVTATSGRSATKYWNPERIYSDGTRLYVTDRVNARVVGWNTLPTATAQAADFVLGQANLTALVYGGTSSTSFSPNGLSISGDGTHLYVADPQRHRVMIWNSMPTTNNQAADLVLGQPNLTTATANNGGVSATSLYTPQGVYSDGTRLYVADGINRVLVWNSAPTSNQQAANLVLGQSGFVSSTDTWVSASTYMSAATAAKPNSVYCDGTRLFLADARNHRVLIWNSIPTSNVYCDI
jgi:hypothetical protein